ncbi:hypothetical protein [Gemmatimonas sp.]|uniref:hypothetical protein n=1 Tax=Gemmatimonas sp. TaxID=1962908 RepID=UPI00398301CC
MSAPTLSIVLAVTNAPAVRDDALNRALDALQRSVTALAGGIACEVIVVLPDGVTAPPNDIAACLHMRVVHAEAGALTPVLWGTGVRAASGRVVAFTTAQLQVGVSWAGALLEAIDTGVDAGVIGAGGPIAPPATERGAAADAAADAAMLVRFHAFLPGRWPRRMLADDIPGDNAAYVRAHLMEHQDLLCAGFWEVEFHRRFSRAGKQLLMVPEALATVQSSPKGAVDLRTLREQRYAHGVTFGFTRVARHGQSTLRIVLAAPLVPLVLLARIVRRARAAGVDHGRVRRALPAMLWLTSAWAAGEAVGALRAARRGKQVTFAHE